VTRRLRTLVLVLVAAALTGPGPAAALGVAEDPSEILVKHWSWDRVTSFEIRGQVELVLRPGPVPTLTVETTRALFDQLSVSNWWGWAAVKVETGLQGPRETGAVKVILEVPSLESLSVADHSSASVVWPGAGGSLRSWEQSTVTAQLSGGRFRVEASWKSSVLLQGRADAVEAVLRQESQTDARDLECAEAEVRVDNASVYRAGPTDRGTGLVRHRSRIERDPSSTWAIREEDGG